MDRLNFFLDNIVKKFDDENITIVWRTGSGKTVDTKVGPLLLTQKETVDKIQLIQSVIDVWKVNQLIEAGNSGDLETISKYNFDRVEKLFTLLKSDIKKMLIEITSDDVYEIDMEKLDNFRERIQKLKVV